MPRGIDFVVKKLKLGKKGVKNTLLIRVLDEENRRIEEAYPSLSPDLKKSADIIYSNNAKRIGELTKDSNTKRTIRAMRGRDKKGRDPYSRGYMKQKLSVPEESRFKKGGSVKAKCKLGRNKPTKLY